MILFRSIFILLFAASIAGAETVIRIVGSHAKSEGQLLELIGNRLAHVREKPASAWRADDAAFLLREVMHKDGYPDVRVAWKIIKINEIQLTVNEGGRLSLGEVTIKGLPDDDEKKFVNLYSSPAEKGRSIGSGAAPFREGDVETGLSFIKQELYAQGYWSAEASVVSRHTDAATGAVNIDVKVTSGVIHEIASPRISSPDGQGVEETRAATKPFIGRKARTANLSSMRLAVEEAFASNGYPDAKIQMGRTLSSPYFIPEFSIDLGKRVRLHQIQIDGLVRTDPKRIAQRVKKLEGDWYNEAAMNKYLRGFLATGAFSSASAEMNAVDENTVDATLHFTEAKAKEITLAAGFGSYQGLITRVTYADRNMLGELLGFSSGFEFSSRGVLGETKITDPWLFGSNVSYCANDK